MLPLLNTSPPDPRSESGEEEPMDTASTDFSPLRKRFTHRQF
jgi:hypothetical protein